ncbi:HAD hydrolase-like protein [Mycoplana sp. MJR14]|uniref:HAD hydrolase-like protein n=1 Tax=Mycoplana sp. MJR14 TaxID=3032583 RepID=UPI0023DB1E95|nr:HAD hydrolase-like protein [Mycoplana sp. MJR14]MDF1633692.1 HAD hydrolase-like protein [Mycoplana sp. MJR14]
MTYDLVIFDFDGTLADTGEWFMSTTNRAAVQFGFRQMSPEQFQQLRSKGNREIIAHMGVPFWKLPKIAAFMREQASRHAAEIRLFPGVVDMLACVQSAGVRTAIVSSNREAVVRTALAQHVRLIDHFACGASLFGKARHFQKLLKATSQDPGRVIAIGDEARDIEAARKAGIAAGSVAWGYAEADFLRSLRPDHFFATVDDIAAALFGGRGSGQAESAR